MNRQSTQAIDQRKVIEFDTPKNKDWVPLRSSEILRPLRNGGTPQLKGFDQRRLVRLCNQRNVLEFGNLAQKTRPTYSSDNILVAGLPRSGTTMVFRALAGLPAGKWTPPDYGGPIIKTHRPNPNAFTGIGAAVFLFGDPVKSALSVYTNRDNRTAFRRLGAAGKTRDDIFSADIFNFETTFDNWTQRQSFDLICVRYETLFDNLDVIRSFFPTEIYLPPKKARKTVGSSYDPKQVAALEKIHSNLIEKIAKAPDVAIYRKGKVS